MNSDGRLQQPINTFSQKLGNPLQSRPSGQHPSTSNRRAKHVEIKDIRRIETQKALQVRTPKANYNPQALAPATFDMKNSCRPSRIKNRPDLSQNQPIAQQPQHLYQQNLYRPPNNAQEGGGDSSDGSDYEQLQQEYSRGQIQNNR